MKLTFTSKIGLVLFLFTFGAFISLGAFSWYLAKTSHDAHFINVAGRQILFLLCVIAGIDLVLFFLAIFFIRHHTLEHKQQIQELSKLSSAVSQTGDSVIITNRDGIIEYVNHSFEELTGYKKEEVIGRTPAILKSGRLDKGFYEQLWKTILAGGIFRAEFINKKKNGRFYYEMKTITPLKDSHGEITHFVSTGKDTTERRRIEEELRNSRDTLEKRSEELERFHQLTVDREIKMMELKKTIKELEEKLENRQ